jgi:hypothetical protein
MRQVLRSNMTRAETLVMLIDSGFCQNPPESLNQELERLNVSRLPSLGTLHYVELNGLTFLQALEAVRVNSGVVNEHIFAVLTRDKAEALRVVEPFHSTLFHFESYFLNFELRLSETERPLADLAWLGEYCSRPVRF